MNANQIVQTSEIICELFEHWKPEDLYKCFFNIKALKYGKFFEGIDGGKVIEMMNIYDVARDEDIMKYNQDKSNEYKNEAKTLPDTFVKILPTIEKIIEKKEVKQAPPKDEVQLAINGFYKEFDAIHKDQNRVHDCGIRMIEYNGKVMNVEDFINQKLKQ
jgi:hypothetical protein